MNTPTHLFCSRAARLFVLAALVQIGIGRSAMAQFNWTIDEVRLDDFPGASWPSPFPEDWRNRSLLSLTVNSELPPGESFVDTAIVYARLTSAAGATIAETNMYDNQPLILNHERGFNMLISAAQIPFLRTSTAAGGWQFLVGSPSSRLAPGGYAIEATLYRWSRGMSNAARGAWGPLSPTARTAFNVPSRDLDLELEVEVSEPSPYFEDWNSERNPNAASINVVNVWQRRYDAYLDQGILESTGGSSIVRITTRLGAFRDHPIALPPQPTYTIRSMDIPLFDSRIPVDVRTGYLDETRGFDRLERRLPEATYHLCFSLKDVASGETIGRYQCSEAFTVENPQPPTCDVPIDSEPVSFLPTFRWSHDVSAPLRATVRYTLEILPCVPGVTPDETFRRASGMSPVRRDNIAGLTYNLATREPMLVAGNAYVWRVRATIPGTVRSVFANQGYSEAAIFVYGSVSDPPRLESPIEEETATLPVTFDWSDVRPPEGTTIGYRLKVRELEASETPSATVFDRPGSTFTLVNGASRYIAPADGSEPLRLAGGRRYAWRVEAFNSRRDSAWIRDGGASAVETFTTAAAPAQSASTGGTPDPRLMLFYPAPGDDVPDRNPPFFALVTLNPDSTWHFTVAITEINRAGAPLGAPQSFTGTTRTGSSPITFVNNQGALSSAVNSRGILAPSTGFTTVPGKRYRWTLQARSRAGGPVVAENSANFTALPRLSNFEAVVSDLHLSESTLAFKATRSNVAYGFAHAEHHPFTLRAVVVSPGSVRATVFQRDTTLRFLTDTSEFNASFSLAAIASGTYRWFVQTLVDGEVVGVSDTLSLVVEGRICESCVCIQGIFPEGARPGTTRTLIPPSWPGNFVVGFTPQVQPRSEITGNIRVWQRSAEEDAATVAARTPVFTGDFVIPAGTRPVSEAPTLTQFNVTPHNAAGSAFHPRDTTNYMYKIETHFDPATIRTDGASCSPTVRSISGYHYFRIGRDSSGAPECNPMITNVNGATSLAAIADTVRLGGYRLILDRPTITYRSGGSLSGRGTVVKDLERWAVEFTDLRVNTTGEVFDGRATARERTLPPEVGTAVAAASGSSGLNPNQVSRITQLWGTAATLFESVGGERMIPFGVNLDVGDPGAATEAGWAVKLAIVKASFEPTRAYYDAVVGVRMPFETTEGPETQWIGLYGQDIPFCQVDGTRWRAALRYLADNRFGVARMTGWDFIMKGSSPEPMGSDYMLEPGDGTALVLSDRGFEQLHIEVGLKFPRNIFVPLRDSSGTWIDVAEGTSGRVEVTGVFDITRDGRSAGEDSHGRPRTLGGGFYMVADLPNCRIANSQFKLAARDITIDLSTSWSPRATAGGSYTVAGMGGAIPTAGTPFTRDADWTGLFVRECSVMIPGLNTPIGVQNLYSSSPVSFTAYAAPMVEATFGDDMTLRLDTIDFSIDRGNFVRARLKTSMTFPGAMEGRIGLDIAYQQVPEMDSVPALNAFIISLNAPESQVYKITNFLDITIARGSQINVSYADRPPTPGGSQWGFAFDLSGGMKIVKREAGREEVSIGGLEYENFRYATDGRGLTAPRISLLGIPIPTDTSRHSTSDTTRGDTASRGTSPGTGRDSTGSSDSTASKNVGGFPIGIRSLDLSFRGGGMQLGISTVVTVALTGEGGGPCFGGDVGISVNGVLAMRDGRPEWGAPSLNLDRLHIDFRSDALTIAGDVTFYRADPTWGNGFGGRLEVSMAKMFAAQADIAFGQQANYRYWYIRGEMALTTPTSPMSIGPVGIFGFMGGAYQHMNVTLQRNATGAITGIDYEPTAENTFGIMAGVHLGVNGDPSSFHTKVELSARFRDDNITALAITGRGWFMCDLEQECNGPRDSWVNLTADFDFDRDRFLLQIAGAINLDPILQIQALPGSVEVLFEPGQWHVYIGRGPFGSPEASPVTARFFPSFARINVQAYLMAGDAINITIGGIPLRGGGFATGVRVEIDISGTFLIFYGRVYGLFQAEMAVIRIDEASRGCIRGANGWYMLADLRMAIGLEIGIEVDLWIISGRFEILSAYMGVQFLVGGPNPTFADGDANGTFSILDGLVSGSFHYHIHVGDAVPRDCISDAIDGQTRMPDPIVSVDPAGDATNVSVFSSIALGFALREGEVISARRDGAERRARFRLLPSLVVQSATGRTVNGSLRVLDGRMSAEWTTSDILEGRTAHTITAVAVAEEWNGSAWVETRRQTKTWSFTTGDRPRDIYDPQIVSTTYPLNRQRYSYVGGHEGKHYVTLARNMNYLFGEMGRNQSLVAEYTGQSLDKRESPITYLPYGSGCPSMLVVENPDLTARTTYHLRLIRRTTIPQNVKSASLRGGTAAVRKKQMVQTESGRGSSVMGTSDDEITLTGGGGRSSLDRAEGTANARVVRREGVIDTVVYDWFFATGQFESPADKMGAMTLRPKLTLGDWAVLTLSGPEPIDDNLHATTLVTTPQSGSKLGPNWFNGIWETDRTLRDYGSLERKLGSHDAGIVAPYLIDHGNRDRTRTWTYVDASTPWSFTNSAVGTNQLGDYELRFETASLGPKIAIQKTLGSGRTGAFSSRPVGTPGLSGVSAVSPSYETDIVLTALNAYQDFNGMRYRYENLVSSGIPLSAGFFPTRVPLALRVSPATIASLTQVSQRRWVARPAGTYSLMVLNKTFAWTRQSVVEGTGGAQRLMDVQRLEGIGKAGSPSGMAFGEISCGGPGRIPFITLEVRIP